MPRLTGHNSDPVPPDQRPAVKVWLQKRNTYMTGFCNDGNCEGTKPKTRSGKGLKTCTFIDTCPCVCHFNLDQMFASVGQPRVLMENPLYAPEHVDFKIEDYIVAADPSPLDDRSTPDGVITPDTVERPSTVPPRRDAGVLATTRTETGRAARGGLEAQVLAACNFFFDQDKDAFPREIADWIAVQYKVPTPSTGAIGAVFNRWVELDFCVAAKKPVRLLDWAGDYEGTWQELEIIKAKRKREKKLSQQAARSGRR